MPRVKRDTGIAANLSWLECILQVCVQRCDARAVFPGGVKVNFGVCNKRVLFLTYSLYS